MDNKRKVYFVGIHDKHVDRGGDWTDDVILYHMGMFDKLDDAMIKANELARETKLSHKNYFIQETDMHMTNKIKVQPGHYETQFVWDCKHE